ncbi:hypothetical protein BJ165DRAFT_1607302 [Panaeolus papilionaceus]|nr:hypothetical protein BJ165DRAFT_1607302 [Panaeolus papilionaceus]
MPSISYPTTDPLPDIVERFEANYLEYPGILHAWGAEEVKNATRVIASKIYLRDFVAMKAIWEYEVIITYYYDACRLWNEEELMQMLMQQMCYLIDGGGRWLRRYLELKRASEDPDHPAFQPEQPKELGCFLVIAQKYDRRHNSFFNGPSSDIEAALSILRPHFPPKRSKWASELSTANSSRSFSRPITPRPQIDLTSLRDRILDWTHSSDA